jgi:hypothetical protein
MKNYLKMVSAESCESQNLLKIMSWGQVSTFERRIELKVQSQATEWTRMALYL